MVHHGRQLAGIWVAPADRIAFLALLPRLSIRICRGPRVTERGRFSMRGDARTCRDECMPPVCGPSCLSAVIRATLMAKMGRAGRSEAALA